MHLSNGSTIPDPQNWSNNNVVYIGTEYKWLQVQQLPIGKSRWRLCSLSDARSSTTFNPAIADADGNALPLGLNVMRKNGSSWDSSIVSVRERIILCEGVGIDLAYFGVLQEPRDHRQY